MPDPDATTGLDPAALATAAPMPAARYALGEEIARGGMGVVYRATDTAFGRGVAVKMLPEKFPPASGAARRFFDEARITGQLQHPAIPPVHDVGTLPDGRPFLAMKLITGDTLDALLKRRADVAADRGRFLAVFEQICQAVAYAHDRGVIHRDLKPANVMVGSFGEVQVMDWGLAKELAGREPPPSPDAVHPPEPDATGDPDGTTAHHPADESTDDRTRSGQAMGTPAYMPPEQARGEIDRVDRRSDVFALGGVLCTILTGKPPYAGSSGADVVRKAADVDLGDALARLDGCGADADLVGLCKRCLSAEPAGRPADGGEVAGLVAAYRADVDARLRTAERERAAAEARAAEQRKKRRVQLALAAAVGLLAAGGAAFAWWQDRQERDREAERQRVASEKQAEDFRQQVEDARRAAAEQGRRDRTHAGVESLLAQAETAIREGDANKAEVALGAAEKRAAEGGAEGLAGRLAGLQEDLAILRSLGEVDQFQFTPLEGKFPSQPALANRYRAALKPFRLDPAAVPAEAAAARVAGSAAREQLVAALDRWLRAEKLPWVRAVLRTADRHDYRDPVRDAMVADDGPKLEELARRPEAPNQPPGFVAMLSEYAVLPPGLRRELVEAARRHRPGDLALLVAMGVTYPTNQPGSAPDRARWHTATVAVAPGNAAAHSGLGSALFDNNEPAAAVAEFEEALRLDPKNAVHHHNLGSALHRLGNLPGAIARYRAALQIDPGLAKPHNNIGSALKTSGDLDGAVAEYREAIRIDPDLAIAHYNLGNALRDKGDLDGAAAAYRAAIRIAPDDDFAHTNLGQVLQKKGNLDAALAEYREALRHNPKNAYALASLGSALKAKGDVDGAIDTYRDSIRLNPKDTAARQNLGAALVQKRDLDGAAAEFREVIRIAPGYAPAHNGLAAVLAQKGDLDAAVAGFEEAVRLQPNNPAFQKNLDFARKEKAARDAKRAVAPPPREVKRP